VKKETVTVRAIKAELFLAIQAAPSLVIDTENHGCIFVTLKTEHLIQLKREFRKLRIHGRYDRQ